jgi:hypothetical protein
MLDQGLSIVGKTDMRIEKMNKTTLVFIGLFLLVCGLWYAEHQLKRDEIINAPVLKENEKVKVIIDPNTKTVKEVRRDKNGKQIIKQTSGGRNTVIVVDDKCNVTVQTRTKGLIFEPGLTLGYTERARWGLDVQFFFWNRFGLNTGVTAALQGNTVYPRAFIGALYTLPFNVVSNTSIVAGMDNKLDLFVGARIKF